MNVREKFLEAVKYESDIQGHIQYLYGESEGIVLELGVREGNSTAALLLGVERSDGHLFSVDVNSKCEDLFKDHPLWTFIKAHSTDNKFIVNRIYETGHEPKFNVIFIDTTHTLEQVSFELKIWSQYLKPEGSIFVHDVTTYATGAGDACRQFAKLYKWDYVVREGWHGLGILTKRQEVIK